MKVFLVALLFGLSGFGCKSGPQPVPTSVDAGMDYAALCAHLKDIGCPEGEDPGCVDTFAIFQGDRMAQLHPSCLMDASSRAQARACGSVSCQ
jgi:hypothetical protein